MDLTVEVDTTEVIAMLESVRRRLEPDRVQAFLGTTVVDYLRFRVDKRFSSEGDDVSGKWAALRPATAAHRASMGFGAYHPINRRTGALWRYVRTYQFLAPTTLEMPGPTASPFLKSKLKVAQVGGLPTAWMGYMGVSGSGPGPTPMSPAVPRPVIGLGRKDSRFVTTALRTWILAGGV